LSEAFLSLAVARAREAGGPAPVGAALMSPWTDLALTGSGMQARAEAHPSSTEQELAAAAQLYLGDHDRRDPLASPLYGDLAGLPPVRIHLGEDEVLLDDSVRFGERFEAAGGVCQVHTWQGMIHVFPIHSALLTAAKEALDDICDFRRRQLRGECSEYDGLQRPAP
jgi:epsilon-lactone hydrolase